MRFALRFILGLAVLAGATPLHAGEFRGLYVDAFHPGFKTPEQVTQLVTAARAANLNALIVQVRKRGDAYYTSAIEPKASDISATCDPLAEIVRQAHAEGIEVHAWLSVYEVAVDNKWFQAAPDAAHRAHPEWLMADREGRTSLAHGKIYLDPGVTAVQDRLLSVVKEVLAGYAVDGIHLDNIRYPDAGSGYNALSLARFSTETGKAGVPDPNDPLWRKWRTEQVTGLVKRIRDAIGEAKPAVKLSASVMCSEPKLAAMQFMQDWGTWTRDGLVDFVVPMVYLTGDSMPTEAPKTLSASHARHVYVGIGAWRIGGALAAKHIADCRAAGAPGVVLYSYHYLGPNSPGGERARLADLGNSAFTERAATASMPWKQEGAAK